ncbi:hypothetical protein [Halalkaliarchaeum desulfuricum]|nr:hypothetical protein [Halalkaliarchaeum desulfuricum]
MKRKTAIEPGILVDRGTVARESSSVGTSTNAINSVPNNST